MKNIILRIKNRLAAKGSKGFLLFEKSMKLADENQDGFLTYEEFKRVIKDHRIDISPTEGNLIFNLFDQEHLNAISYLTFVQVVKGETPAERLN